jgi:hypothetical protein
MKRCSTCLVLALLCLGDLAGAAEAPGEPLVGGRAPRSDALLETRGEHGASVHGEAGLDLIAAAIAADGTADDAVAPSRGLFDLASPVLARIDGLMSSWLPPLGRLTLWGLLAAFVSMGLYRLTSNQARLAANKEEIVALQRRLKEFDGPFAEAWPLLRRNLALAGHRLWLTLGPALLASLPVIFILAWVSNTFDARFPRVGDPVRIEAVAVDGSPLPPLRWQGDGDVRTEREGLWTLAWPTAARPLNLVDGDGAALLTLPPAAPVGAVHQRRWWNALVGNPAGYLPGPGPVDAVELDLPHTEFLPFGPAWLRGWMVWFFGVVLAASLLLKFLWRLH